MTQFSSFFNLNLGRPDFLRLANVIPLANAKPQKLLVVYWKHFLTVDVLAASHFLPTKIPLGQPLVSAKRKLT